MPDQPVQSLPDSRWWRWLLVSAVVLALDQASKAWISTHLTLGESRTILPFFNLVSAVNTGAAFSFLAEASGWQRHFFVGFATIVTAILLWLLRTNRHGSRTAIALALVIGGAIGNLVDRVRLGHVVDFVQVHAMGLWNLPPWPAFNVADSAICVGAALMIWEGFRSGGQHG